MTKEEIRNRMRHMRKTLTADRLQIASHDACERLKRLAHGKRRIAVYLALPLEIDLGEFIDSSINSGIKVVAPRWNGSGYDLAFLTRTDDGTLDLREGPMKVMEPRIANAVDPATVDMWVVPGLAFDRNGGRIGYGGGWYDRMLESRARSSVLVGVALEFQVLPSLPIEPHDVRLDEVIAVGR